MSGLDVQSRVGNGLHAGLSRGRSQWQMDCGIKMVHRFGPSLPKASAAHPGGSNLGAQGSSPLGSALPVWLMQRWGSWHRIIE